jgi:hypothetical protein
VIYNKDGKPKPDDVDIDNEDSVHVDYKGPDVLESEVRKAFKEMK